VVPVCIQICNNEKGKILHTALIADFTQHFKCRPDVEYDTKNCDCKMVELFSPTLTTIYDLSVKPEKNVFPPSSLGDIQGVAKNRLLSKACGTCSKSGVLNDAVFTQISHQK